MKQPLPPDHVGVAVVAVCALLSICFCTGLFVFVAYQAVKGTKKPESHNENVSSSGGAARRFLKTQFGILFLNLCFADLLQGLGFVLNFAWLAQDGFDDPASPSTTCTAQAVLIQTGDVASSLSSMLIAIHTFLIIVIRWHPTNVFMGCALASIWSFVIVMTSLGAAVGDVNKGPFYSIAGGWCWINGNYQVYRLTLHYLWVFVAALVNTFCYAIIFISIRRQLYNVQVSDQSLPAEHSSIESIARKMLLYPFAFLVLVLPIAVTRLHSMTGHEVGYTALFTVGSVYTLSGMINVILFSVTRRMIKVKSVRKLSWSSSRNTGDRDRNEPGQAQTTPQGRRPNSFLPMTISFEVYQSEDVKDSENGSISLHPLRKSKTDQVASDLSHNRTETATTFDTLEYDDATHRV